MRALVWCLCVAGALAGCLNESHGGGGAPLNQEEDWYAGVASPAPLTFDATTTHYEYTLEATLTLMTSTRRSTREITGVDVIAELDMPRTDTKIGVELAREGEAPGMYGTGVTRGTYTYGHGEATVLEPLASCYTPPCTATERYTLAFDAIENPGSVPLTWRANVHVILNDADPYDGIKLPADDESLTLSIVTP